ncbi:hypothetical protein VO56_02155 [Mycoplasmopsis gallinacea]|uniref:Uncharacterized protein n=1 Tax=Mycoplasmopsis gallinacea TaxID=29556 RepID=A0A0D5ZJZ0_9BACT|nr:hypothetical protein VO56_02155 [Mycoplasmopsis gallinacea]
MVENNENKEKKESKFQKFYKSIQKPNRKTRKRMKVISFILVFGIFVSISSVITYKRLNSNPLFKRKAKLENSKKQDTNNTNNTSNLSETTNITPAYSYGVYNDLHFEENTSHIPRITQEEKPKNIGKVFQYYYYIPELIYKYKQENFKDSSYLQRIFSEYWNYEEKVPRGKHTRKFLKAYDTEINDIRYYDDHIFVPRWLEHKPAEDIDGYGIDISYLGKVQEFLSNLLELYSVLSKVNDPNHSLEYQLRKHGGDRFVQRMRRLYNFADIYGSAGKDDNDPSESMDYEEKELLKPENAELLRKLGGEEEFERNRPSNKIKQERRMKYKELIIPFLNNDEYINIDQGKIFDLAGQTKEVVASFYNLIRYVNSYDLYPEDNTFTWNYDRFIYDNQGNKIYQTTQDWTPRAFDPQAMSKAEVSQIISNYLNKNRVYDKVNNLSASYKTIFNMSYSQIFITEQEKEQLVREDNYPNKDLFGNPKKENLINDGTFNF